MSRKPVFGKFTKYLVGSIQSEKAKKEAARDGIPFCPWPMQPWMVKNIKARYAETGELLNAKKCNFGGES